MKQTEKDQNCCSLNVLRLTSGNKMFQSQCLYQRSRLQDEERISNKTHTHLVNRVYCALYTLTERLCHLSIRIDDLKSTLFFSNTEHHFIHLQPGDTTKSTRSEFTECHCDSNHNTSLRLNHIATLSCGK